MSILLQPVEVVRDQYGYWTHPDLSKVSTWGQGERVTGTQFELFMQQQNFEAQTVFFDGDAPTEIHKRYENGDPDVSDWQPTTPQGDGWFMLSLHDTEDSPICWWVRRKEPFIPVDLLNQFKQDMISHGYGSFYSFDTFDNGNFKHSNTKTLFVGWKAATAQAVPEGYVVVPVASLEEALSWVTPNSEAFEYASPGQMLDWFKHEEILKSAIQAAKESE